MPPVNLPPYPHFPVLRNERIMLRQVFPADLKDLMEISYYDAVQAKTIEEAAEMQQRIDLDYLAGNSIHWLITDNGSRNIVGTCGFYRGFDNGEGELGCILLPAYRGQGYMSAAMQLAIDFGFQRIGLRRIKAITSRSNKEAIKLLERLQFQRVGTLGNDELEFEIRL